MKHVTDDSTLTDTSDRDLKGREREALAAARPAPPVDRQEDEYLQRAEQLIDVSQGVLAEVIEEEIPAGSRSGEARSEAIALSVVIPVYNEEATVRQIVERVRAVGLHKEIVVVDDCSTDGTRDVLRQLERDEDVRVFLHGYNRGKGAALRTGFDQVKGNIVIIQDADLEYDPQDYPSLLEPIRAGEADVVYGSRFLANPRQDPSWLHRFGNWLLTAASNRLTGQNLTDMETCYKVFRRDVLERLKLQENRFGFEPEITAKISQLGIRIHEVPIRYCSRSYREGKKIGLRDGISALHCIIRYSGRDE